MNWIKGLTSKISQFARLIIFVILVGYIVFTRFNDYGTILPTLEVIQVFSVKIIIFVYEIMFFKIIINSF